MFKLLIIIGSTEASLEQRLREKKKTEKGVISSVQMKEVQPKSWDNDNNNGSGTEWGRYKEYKARR